MANPFLVLGGIAVGIITATFGILQVPGWVDSAKDASAKNDISQVSLAQAAALSQDGKVRTLIETSGTNKGLNDGLGVTVTTSAPVSILPHDSDTSKYAVVVTSGSGKVFVRYDGGVIAELAKGTTAPTTYAAAKTAVDAYVPPAG